MMSTIDFPTWFSYGCYGGLAFCILAIAVNALYTTLCKRGSALQLTMAVVSLVLAALLLLPAVLWYHLRFSRDQAALSALEVGLILVYVAFCGWIVPCMVTTAYCLFTSPRLSGIVWNLLRPRKRTTRAATATASERLNPPRRQPGTPGPFVYSSDRPWGWLVYRNGKFVGQELALKHTIVSIGREEDNEVWLDDDTISRYHAELAWEQGQITVTDADSLNGVLLNGQRIRSSVLVKEGDELGFGSLRFWLKCAQKLSTDELDDPLLPQLRRVALARGASSDSWPINLAGDKVPAKPTVALDPNREPVSQSPLPGATPALTREPDVSELETIRRAPITPTREPDVSEIKTLRRAPAPLANAFFSPPLALHLPSKPEKSKPVDNPKS